MPFTYKEIPANESEEAKTEREFREMRVRADYEDMIDSALKAIPIHDLEDFEIAVRDLEKILASTSPDIQPNFDSKLKYSMKEEETYSVGEIWEIYSQKDRDTQVRLNYTTPENDAEYQQIIKERIKKFNSYTIEERRKHITDQAARRVRAERDKAIANPADVDERRAANARTMENERREEDERMLQQQRMIEAQIANRRATPDVIERLEQRSPASQQGTGFDFLARHLAHQDSNPNQFLTLLSDLRDRLTPDVFSLLVGDLLDRPQFVQPQTTATQSPAFFSTTTHLDTDYHIIGNLYFRIEQYAQPLVTGETHMLHVIVNSRVQNRLSLRPGLIQLISENIGSIHRLTNVLRDTIETAAGRDEVAREILTTLINATREAARDRVLRLT